jgi:hypothetical protein
MNNLFFIILNLAVLILIGKYIYDLRSDKTLVSVLVLFGLACLGIILANSFHAPIFISVGYVAGLILSPLIFAIYLFRQYGDKEEKRIRRLMLIPVLILFVVYLLKALHLPVYGIVHVLMIVSVLLGGWIVMKKPVLKEIKPFQIALIFLLVDVLRYIMN